MIKIGVIKEYKKPFDSRCPITPSQSKKLNDSKDFSVSIQESDIRCFSDEEYLSKNVEVCENLNHCDVIIGIKEIPTNKLLKNKTYIIFSHTIKKQRHNRSLLREIISKKIKLIDYECLTKNNRRVIAFGKYAGIAGAYNSLMGYGIKNGNFKLKRLNKFHSVKRLYNQNRKLKIREPFKVLLTGTGQVSKGSEELLKSFKIKKISVQDFLKKRFKIPTYTVVSSSNYYEHKNKKEFNRSDFYSNPENYISTFKKFIPETDVLINGTFWNPNSPRLFEENQLNKNFKIKVIGDITCDINGSIPCTKFASSIEEPFFDYCPKEKKIKKAFSSEEGITMMSIDNLASELPRDSSEYFGQKLISEVLPLLLEDNDSVIERATITMDGKLLKRYSYLEDYIN